MAHIRRPILVGLQRAAPPNSEATRLADPPDERGAFCGAGRNEWDCAGRRRLGPNRPAGVVRRLIGAPERAVRVPGLHCDGAAPALRGNGRRHSVNGGRPSFPSLIDLVPGVHPWRTTITRGRSFCLLSKPPIETQTTLVACLLVSDRLL